MLKFDIQKYDILPSTNTFLKEKAICGAEEGSVIIAKEQSKGKGSKGRSFYSPNNGLYFSILLRPQRTTMEQNLYLTPCMAVAVATAIDKIAQIDVKIKWVNDIYYKNKKICGILTESGTDKAGKNFIIIGTGINISPPENGFPKELCDIAGTICNEETDKNFKDKLLEQILKNLSYYYENLLEKEYIEIYRSKSLIIGNEITVERSNEKYKATAIGIDDNFQLEVVKENNEKITLNSAEVSLRKHLQN
jgi:BirA family biotin operon repressor/biotin-[acetyl-CoA-carboxylase] ligase